MRNRYFALEYEVVRIFGRAGAVLAQDNGVQQPSAH
jgi:hypothetical protein